MRQHEASACRNNQQPELTDMPADDRNSAWRTWLNRVFVQPFVSSTHPPWFDARGVAIGLAISLGCPVGLQMVTLGITRLLVRFNLLIAFAVSWVMNPFTFVPIYYGYYWLGSVLLDRPATMTVEAFRALMVPVTGSAHFWETFRSFVALGWEFVLRWSAGAAVVTSVATVLGYVAAYSLQRSRCRRNAEKLGLSYSQLMRDLETRSSRRCPADGASGSRTQSV